MKSNIESFSQLLRLLCWCPAYISTPDAMETGVFVWTWLVSAAPQLGSLVLAELVDAWLWTIDTKRGLFASEMRCAGPAAKLRPHLSPGEPELQPEKDPVEQIIAHRIWLGYFIDRFEVCCTFEPAHLCADSTGILGIKSCVLSYLYRWLRVWLSCVCCCTFLSLLTYEPYWIASPL